MLALFFLMGAQSSETLKVEVRVISEFKTWAGLQAKAPVSQNLFLTDFTPGMSRSTAKATRPIPSTERSSVFGKKSRIGGMNEEG